MRDFWKKAGGALALAIILAAAGPDDARAQTAAAGDGSSAASLEAQIAEAVELNRLVVFKAAIEGGKLVITGVTPEPD